MKKDEKRGEVVEVIFVTKYPDNSISIGRLNAQKVRKIVLSHDLIKEHIGPELVATEWNTGNWQDNPSVLVDVLDNGVKNCGWYCQKSGHGTGISASDLAKVGYLGKAAHGNEPVREVKKKLLNKKKLTKKK